MSLSEDPRFGKLPAWVRSGVSTLEMRLREAQEHEAKACLANGPKGSNTFIDAYDRNPIWLPNHERVRFVVGDDYREYIDVSVNREAWLRGTIQLMSGGSVFIKPHSTNVIHMGVKD